MGNTILCQAGRSCIGCCISLRAGCPTNEELLDDLKKNTQELQKQSVASFMGRTKREVRPSGACMNLVKLNSKEYGCAGHPARNKGKELRDHYKGWCNKEFLCDTAELFNKWTDKQQKEFLTFLKKKKLNLVDYSLGLDSGDLLKEFRRQKK